MRPARGDGADRRRFEQRARQARTLRRRPVLLALLLVVLVAAGVYLVGFSSVLAARTVVVEGVPQAQQAAVREAAAIPTGVPLARIDLDAPGRRVVQSPLYASVEVARKWPSTVLITVTPRTPVLALKRSGDFQLVDADGVAYQTVGAAPAGVPVASGKGEVSPQGLRAAISVMSTLPGDLRGKVSAVQVQGPSMVTFQLDKTTVLWGDESEPQLKVKVLRALLSKGAGTINVSAPHSPATS
ncbi:cell division protein FtsQ/DivIB [Arsenicicoccus sp. oral taxon 190]|uniref:cell division protein FtsQ/DivIB n=1 Tax=Arsenicicoccus sp. oral taxon 190 TaxID=1658671 RepID=UPI00155D9FD0|nr:FtsQ-type POTRA domain-containing protein [Arsenicicoccus sp. oral taxon 190]